jgi:hypothetical protein
MSSRARQKQLHREEAATTWSPFEKLDDEKTGAILTDPDSSVWANNRYVVIKRYMGDGAFGPLYHLSIRRTDRQPARDWRDLQRIKNELVGPEAEGVELFPAESRLVDTANQFHLWVLEKQRFPFGWNERLVTEAGRDAAAGAVQRPFEEKPPDLATKEELEQRMKGLE